MKSFLKYLLLPSTMLIASCFWALFEDEDDGESLAYVEITNNSEYNITRVVVIETKTGNAVINETNDELIAKNGSSKSFNINEGVEKLKNGYFIACIDIENTSEPMCTTTFFVARCCVEQTISLTWDGGNNSNWLPFSVFPACPKIFAQCEGVQYE